MWIVVVLLLLQTFKPEEAAEYPVQLLMALRHRFSCNSVMLLYEDNQNITSWKMISNIAALRKLLSKELVPSSSPPMQSFSGRPQSLAVLLSSEHDLRHILSRISAGNGLRGPIWFLMAGSSQEQLRNLLLGVDVPLDSQLLVGQRSGDTVTLMEVFRVAKNLPLRTTFFGKWEMLKNRAHWSIRGLYTRRYNLEGFSFRVASRENLSLLTSCEDYAMNNCPFFNHVWSVIRANLHCGKSLFQVAPDLQWGSVMANGSWTGLAGQVVRGEVDMAVDWITITHQRLNAMDYSAPVLSSRLYVYIGLNGLGTLEWNNFLKPFSSCVWLCVVAAMLITACYMSLLYRVGRKWAHFKYEPQCHNIWVALYYVYGGLCQTGHNITPSGISTRVIYLTWYITCLVLMASYSASLISIIATVEEKPPFSSFQELLNLGTYPLGMTRASAHPDIFKDSKNALLTKIYNKLIAPYVELTPETDLARGAMLCSSRYAYLTSVLLKSTIKPFGGCKIVAVPEASLAESLAMLLTKGSPYKRLIDHKIHEMREAGILKRIASSVWPQRTSFSNNHFQQVELLNVTPVFVILLFGIGASIIILLVERCLPVLLPRKQHEEQITVHPRDKYTI